MIVARVTGNIISTVKHRAFSGRKLQIVQPLDHSMKPKGSAMIAIDMVDAGTGDNVLVMKEGGSARMLLDMTCLPAQAVIVGVIDSMTLDNWNKPVA